MRRYIPIVTLLLLTVLSPLALAQVGDSAGFFTPNAVERANQLISQMRQQTGKDLVVETVPGVPSNLQQQFQSLGKERFFDEYAVARARQAGTNGVYVLVCRDPSYLKVAVGDSTQRQAFTTADRDRLAEIFLSNFRQRQFDQGLLEGVNFVQRTITTHARQQQGGAAAGAGTGAGAAASPRTNSNQTIQRFPSAPGQQTSPGATPAPVPQERPQQSRGLGLGFWILLIGAGLVLFMFLRRRMARRTAQYGTSTPTSGAGGLFGGMGRQQSQYGAPPPLPGQQHPGYGGGYGYPGQQQTGGGMGRGVLGGLLGGMAGGWLWDKMGNRHPDTSHTAGAPGGGVFPGQGPGPGPANPDYYSDTPDRNFSTSSGGDFSDAGGGDLGGGGGDFGGGSDDDRGGGGSF